MALSQGISPGVKRDGLPGSRLGCKGRQWPLMAIFQGTNRAKLPHVPMHFPRTETHKMFFFSENSPKPTDPISRMATLGSQQGP